MAKPIKHSNKGNIVFLNQGSYDHLYSSILRVLGKDAPFAPLNIQGSNLTWTSPTPDVYVSLADAPEDVVGTLAVLWEQLKKDLSKKLLPKKLDFVLEIPDESFIFYAENKDSQDGVLKHKYKLLITGWACQHGHAADDDGLLGLKKRMFEAQNKHQNVIVKMQDSNKVPLVNADFVYEYANSVVKNITTDDSGCYQQGVCVVGSKLAYTYALTGQTQVIVVQKNIEVYPITYAPTIDVNIKIVDQFENPVQSHPVRIEYGSRSFNVDTDGLGEIHLTQILYIDSSLQFNIDVKDLGTEVFDAKCPVTNIKMNVEVAPEIAPYLKVLREGVPEKAHSIRLTGKIVGTYSSDDEGCIPLKTLKWGDSFSAESTTEAQALKQTYTIVDGQAEYIYELPVEEKPEPVPEPPVPDEPVPVPEPPIPDEPVPAPEPDAPVDEMDCILKVVRGENVVPQPDFSVHIKGLSTLQGVQLTDENGQIPLGKLKVGTSFSVSYDKAKFPVDFVVEEGKDEYVLLLDKEVEQSIKAYLKVLKRKDFSPVPGYNLEVKSVHVNGHFVTDSEGIVPLEGVVLDEEVYIYLIDEKDTENITITAEKEEYQIFLGDEEPPLGKEVDLDYHIKLVEGDNNAPVGGYSLFIDSHQMQGNFSTDAWGILPLNGMHPGDTVMCYTDVNAAPVTFMIEAEKQEYVIKIDPPKEILKGDIMVTLLDKDKKTPVTPAVITLTNKQGKKYVQTNDSNGNIIVPRSFFTDGQKVRFHAEHENHKIKDCKFVFHDKYDHYLINLCEPLRWKKLLWIFLLPLILLLSLIPCTKDITVHVLDTNTNNVAGAYVQLKYNEHALYKNSEFFYNRARMFQGMTNKDGYHTFQDVPCSVYSYIFYSFQGALVNGRRNVNVSGSTNFRFHWRNDVDVIVSERKSLSDKNP